MARDTSDTWLRKMDHNEKMNERCIMGHFLIALIATYLKSIAESVQFFSRDLGMRSKKKVYYRPVSYKCTIMFGHGLSLSNQHFHLIACLMPES